MKKLLLLSGKGGTGKTTAAAAFTRFAQAKAVADCDVDAPNLHLVTEQTAEPLVSRFMGGDKAVIDPDLCIGCGTCQKHCRFDAVVEKTIFFSLMNMPVKAAASVRMYVRRMPSG